MASVFSQYKKVCFAKCPILAVNGLFPPSCWNQSSDLHRSATRHYILTSIPLRQETNLSGEHMNDFFLLLQ